MKKTQKRCDDFQEQKNRIKELERKKERKKEAICKTVGKRDDSNEG